MAETTTRDLARQVVTGEVPPINTIRMQYDIFLPDAFGNLRTRQTSSLLIRFQGDLNTAPAVIDGFRNDDSYRSSRHFGLNTTLAEGGGAALTRIQHENSLARTLDEKKDQPAVLRLLARKDPSSKNLESLIPPNTKFFLEQVDEPREEKFQVVETFGEFTAFFFGRKPEFYSFSGTLLNAKNHDWKNEFHINYDEFLRGTKCVERKAFVYIQYDDVMVEGFIIGCTTRMSGVQDKGVPFSFQMLVTNRQPTNRIDLLRSRQQRAGLTELEQGLLRTLEDAAAVAKKSGKTEDSAMFAIIRDFMAVGKVPASSIVAAVNNTTQINAGTRAQSQESQKSEFDANVEAAKANVALTAGTEEATAEQLLVRDRLLSIT